MLQYDQRKMKGENLETTANGGNKMYYSSGNYEAFARPKKPVGVDRKSAYLVGTGLAALTAACTPVSMPARSLSTPRTLITTCGSTSCI